MRTVAWLVPAVVTTALALTASTATALALTASTATAAPPAPTTTTTTIAAIQGPGFTSPLAGRAVSGVEGVVTAVRTSSPRGFWIQSRTPDRDDATSDAAFVVTNPTAPAVAVGDEVAVDGTVTEFRSGGASSTNLSVTEITSPTVTTKSRRNALPAPLVIGPTTVPDRFAPPTTGDVETIGRVQARRSAQEFWEAHEGMRVEIPAPRVIAPSNTYGDVYITSKPFTQNTYRGDALLSSYDLPTGRLHVTALDGAKPTLTVGDRFAGPVTGVVDWSSFGGFTVDAPSLPRVVPGGLARTVAGGAAPGELSVATYNVENLAPGDSDAKYAALSAGVVRNLGRPDIVAVEEVQDNSGAADDGTTAADRTIRRLTDAIAAAGGPRYASRSIDPANDADGGQPGGNIRTVFLFDPTRVSFVDRGIASSTTATTVVRGPSGRVQLSQSPGRIAPADPAWTNSRKPLVGEFTFRGRTVFVIGNHFASKGGDQSADGRFQPPARSSETQRDAQAQVENDWVRATLAVDPRAAIVSAGDFNDFPFSPALRTLTSAGALTDLITTLPRDRQYTYVYSGVSQVLDHILVSRALRPSARYEVVHLNSEFPDQVSDHDPQVVRVRP
ncbi:endonuclease/exonuclease/phosphatase family protein [uncultured Williamsia sp.]|uniref:endonuclease/exonuclease/phosphatase family protein n=1 Tax=uncultured Williamsia sp. TaxID=259311 RepID=UPI0026081C51|nr:endonuclease/exonuclease/phosphatase family protein [uncultured Williamsia sp.]